MKRILIILICIAPFTQSVSQTSLQEIFQRQNNISRKGMYTLGGWAAGNLLVNSGLLLTNPEPQTRHFYEMNIYWNLVNLGLAGISLIQIKKSSYSGMEISDLLKRQKKLENILLLNAGLDVAYVVGGFYLRELGKNEMRNQDLLTGFGNSIILQGSFLLIFDVILYMAHSRHAGKWMPILNKMHMSHQGIGFRFTF